MLAAKSAPELVRETREYAAHYHPGLLDLIDRDTDYFRAIVNIEREKENPRKDYSSYESIYDLVKYFYRDHYENDFDATSSIRHCPWVPSRIS
jgi:hypothetical protein